MGRLRTDRVPGSPGISEDYDQLAKVYNHALHVVEDYGGDPTGALPSTTAYANALTEARAEFVATGIAPEIVFGPGTFTGTFPMAQQVKVRGAGQFQTILKPVAGQTTPVVTLAADSDMLGVELSDVYVQGDRAMGGTQDGVYLNGVNPAPAAYSAANVHDIQIYSCGGAGLHLAGKMAESTFRNITIDTTNGPNLFVDAGVQDCDFIRIRGGESYNEYSCLVSGTASGLRFVASQFFFNHYIDPGTSLPKGKGWGVFGDGIELSACSSQDNAVGLLASGSVIAPDFVSMGDQVGCIVQVTGSHGGKHNDIGLTVHANDRWLPEKGFVFVGAVKYGRFRLNVMRFAVSQPAYRGDDALVGDHDGALVTLAAGSLNVDANFKCFDQTAMTSFVGDEFEVQGHKASQFATASVVGATWTPDALDGMDLYVTLDANLTVSLKHWFGISEGKEIVVHVTQNATGGHTVAFDGAYFRGGPFPAADAAANHRTIYRFRCTNFQNPFYDGSTGAPFFRLVSTASGV